MEDPSLIPRLVQDPNEKAASEVTDEQQILPALLIGEMIPAGQVNEHPARIGVLMQYLEKARQAGLQISPEGQQAIMARLDQLLAGYEQVDTNNARSMRADVEDYLRQTGMIPSEEDQQAAQVQQIMQQMQPQQAAV